MKHLYIFLLASLIYSTGSNAQTVTDFTKKDCNTGASHNLFSELNSGKAIIMEFFHTCISCSNAAKDIKPMYQNLVLKYGNKVLFYVMPEDDSYTCSDVLNWVNTNGLSSVVIPLDSGSVQTAYYGGMAMPSIAVVAGSAHQILYLVNANTASFATSDTGIIGTAIRNFLDSTLAGVPSINSNVSVSVFPNPVSNSFEITIETKEAGTLKLEVTNITGDKVAELTEEKIQTGVWNRNFPVSLSNGVYFIKGSINEKVFNKKMSVQH